MSLDQLRTMRRDNLRPESVTVLIGQPPKWFDDDASFVVIDRDPREMDLSPLVGLPVHVLDMQEDSRLALHVLCALEDLNVQSLGVCGPAGSCGVSPDHEYAMDRYRRLLCTE